MNPISRVKAATPPVTQHAQPDRHEARDHRQHPKRRRPNTPAPPVDLQLAAERVGKTIDVTA